MAEVYRTGSRGEGVRQLQRMLGMTGAQADGVFGTKTEAAVKVFQRSAGLSPDGIAGPATLSRLRAVTPDITDGHISVHVTRCAARPLRYIAIHYTAGGNSRRGAAMSARNVFLSRSASADFVVDDEQTVQVSPDVRNYYCWAVGDKKYASGGGGSLYGTATNRNTISIEVCSTLKSGTASVPNHEGWAFTDKVLDRALSLVRYLMMVYGIPKSCVIRHYDVSGKPCPGIVGWNDAELYTLTGARRPQKNNSRKWLDFKGRI